MIGNNNVFAINVSCINLEWMENVLENEIDEITNQIELLFELAQIKAEKMKRVREIMEEYKQMLEDY